MYTHRFVILYAVDTKTEEEKALEESLFGKDILSDKTTSHWIDDLDAQVDFNIDTNPSKIIVAATNGQPAWIDEDDEDIEVDLNETNRLKKLKKDDQNLVSGAAFTSLLQERFDHHQKPAWANPQRLDDLEEEDVLDVEDYQLLQQTGSMVTRKTRNRNAPLPHGTISIKRLADANMSEPSSSSITTTHFHPNSELFLIASEDKQLKVFQIDEEKNPKQLGLKFQDIQIRSAYFSNQGHEMVVSGRKPYYYFYDMTSGHLTKVQGKSPLKLL